MGTYWRKVFARAWADTKQSFGWNITTLVSVLVVLAGVVGTLFQLGFGAAFESATGLLWPVLPVVGVAFVLFAWNFFSAIIDVELSTRTDQKVAVLQSALANLRQPPPPDYRPWRHVDQLALWEAAFLWCDLSPAVGPMPSNVAAWYGALAAAVTKGELKFVFRDRGYGDSQRHYDNQKRNPELGTSVKRTALQAWAKKHNYDPKFLKDA
jgi:hypothetical protein